MVGGWALSLWWAGPCLGGAHCLLMSGAVFPLCCLFGPRQPSTGAYRLLDRANDGFQESSHQWAVLRIAVASVFVLTVIHCHPSPLQETLQHLQTGLVQLPVGSLLLSLGSWYDCVCALQASSLCLTRFCGSPAVKSCWPLRSDSLGIPSSITRHPGWESWHVAKNLQSSGRTAMA